MAMLITPTSSQLCLMTIKSLLAKHSPSICSRTGRVFVSVVDAAVDQVQVVDFDVSSSVVGILVLLLSHDVGVDVVERTVGVEAILVEVVGPPISLAVWQFIILEFVFVTAIARHVA
jgi:hypothetical protein